MVKESFNSNIPNASDVVENPILTALQDNNLCESDISQTIAEIFLRFKTEADKKKISLKRLIMVSKEARPWADILLKLYNAYPAEKREHSGHVTLEEIIKAQDKGENQ